MSSAARLPKTGYWPAQSIELFGAVGGGRLLVRCRWRRIAVGAERGLLALHQLVQRAVVAAPGRR